MARVPSRVEVKNYLPPMLFQEAGLELWRNADKNH